MLDSHYGPQSKLTDSGFSFLVFFFEVSSVVVTGLANWNSFGQPTMAHLTPLQHDTVVYIGQQYALRAKWWERHQRQWVLPIMRGYYSMDLGITRQQAIRIEKTATALTDGWMWQTLPSAQRAFVEDMIFCGYD